MLCPVCEQDVRTDEFMLHAMYQHPQFFVVWASLSLPTLAPMMDPLLMDLDDEIDGMEYEELLELCNTIGYHKVGVGNIDAVTEKCTNELLDDDWQCMICLEKKDVVEDVRKITACSHCFCSTCIETWLEEHKTCPICKKNAEVSGLDEPD